MKLELVRIGNSRGIRIPKPLIEQCGFGDMVEVHVEEDRLILEADRSPRKGWAKAFQNAGADDAMLLEGVGPNEFDKEEWQW